jgi:PAS domain S-box-containing protein
LLALLDRRFDEFAADAHEILALRALVAVGAAAVAMLLLPWTLCALWAMATLAVELWGWFASRDQYLGRAAGRGGQLMFAASLATLITAWFGLGLAFWLTGRLDGAVCAVIVWLTLSGFAQTFASRTPVGFGICGVAPAVATITTLLVTPQASDFVRMPVIGVMALSIGFALAGAQQTFRAGRRLGHLLAALRDREEQYRVLADNVSDTISLRAVGGAVRYVSPAVVDALGYTPEEFAAIDPLEPVHPDDRARMRETYQGLLATGAGATLEYRRVRKDGAPTWTESSFTLVTDPTTGEPREVISVSRDVNARKAMEQQLVEARERAEAGAAAKAEFLANMTHELRTPLNAIIGFSRILKDSTELSARDARHADLISAASATLLTVVNDVLDFSKLESGAFVLEARPFDPLMMTQAVAALVEEQAIQRGLALTVRGRGDNLALMGDGARLQQVLLNLLSNALKFTQVGGVDVTLDQAPAKDGARWLRVEVSDTGIGVPVGQLDAIFERFNQADGSVSRRFGGTGLGLAICKRIIELMHGRIGVTSREGEGSTFWFEVVMPPAASADGEPVAAEPAAAELDRPIRLLLVEDVDVNRELVRVMLEPFDVAIDIAGNGEEAIAAVSLFAYDLVLMDVQMPVMDGLTAARRIRALADPAASSLPIIAMTANVLPDQIRRCLEAGMDGHLGKPISPADLLQALAHWSAHTREPAALVG